MERPDPNNQITVTGFKDFYWLKQELVAFCKSVGINASGSKPALTERIVTFLQTGEITKSNPKHHTLSKFDWQKSEITLDTIITDNYKNSENVRAFMKGEIGSSFHFNTAFMDWMKQHTGQTMREAIATWHRINALKKTKNYRTDIPPQFEYNTYIRDFLADNKDKTLQDAIRYWKLKRNRQGDNVYSKADLKITLE